MYHAIAPPPDQKAPVPPADRRLAGHHSNRLPIRRPHAPLVVHNSVPRRHAEKLPPQEAAESLQIGERGRDDQKRRFRPPKHETGRSCRNGRRAGVFSLLQLRTDVLRRRLHPQRRAELGPGSFGRGEFLRGHHARLR